MSALLTNAGIAIAEALELQAATLYVAVGEGLVEWDALATVPQPAAAQTALNNELARELATVEYLDDSGVVVAGPTRYLRVSATFAIGVANGTLREVGVFAFGTGTIDTGQLLAAANFAAVEKPAGGSDFAFPRAIRLTFLG